MTLKDIEVLPLYYKDGNLYWAESTSNRVKKDSIAGTITEHGYRFLSINKKRIYAHRVIFLIHNGYMPKYIDHVNGNRLDNRPENLRACNSSQNSANRKKLNTNKSGFKGTHFIKSTGKWRAQITIDSKCKHLGYYKTAEEAHEKYKSEFINHFKEFAKL